MLKGPPLVGALAISLLSTHADSMTYSFHKLNENDIIIDASGRIDPNEASALRRFIANYIPQGLTIRGITLNSRGGEINDAKEVVEYVRNAHWTTGIPMGGVCASACVMVWSSGAVKFASSPSWVGVHQSFDSYGDKDGSVDRAGTAIMDNILRENGAPQSVLDQEHATPPSQVYWLSDDDLRAWNVRAAG
jgi:hypothetical protein